MDDKEGAERLFGKGWNRRLGCNEQAQIIIAHNYWFVKSECMQTFITLQDIEKRGDETGEATGIR